MMKHIVQQGEDMALIAQSLGFKPETIWNHASNAELKRQRDNADVLNPGDLVDIPDKKAKHEKCETDTRHKFKVATTKTFLRLQFLDGEEEPRNGLDFELEVNNNVYYGTTSEGLIEQEIPRAAKQAKVKFPEMGEVYIVKLGHLDSADSVFGAQHRLTNLGFGPGRQDGVLGPKSKSAIKRFQQKCDLEQTGELDNATSRRLMQEHGC